MNKTPYDNEYDSDILVSSEFIRMISQDYQPRTETEIMMERIAHANDYKKLYVKIPNKLILNNHENGYSEFYLIDNMRFNSSNYVAMRALIKNKSGEYEKGSLALFQLSKDEKYLKELHGEVYDKIYQKFLEKTSLADEECSESTY